MLIQISAVEIQKITAVAWLRKCERINLFVDLQAKV